MTTANKSSGFGLIGTLDRGPVLVSPFGRHDIEFAPTFAMTDAALAALMGKSVVATIVAGSATASTDGAGNSRIVVTAIEIHTPKPSKPKLKRKGST